jgi:hypothetical protein
MVITRLKPRTVRLPPQFNLALQGLEIPLDSVHAYRERINQVEALGVLGQDRREHAGDNVSKSLGVCVSIPPSRPLARNLPY